MRMMTFSNWESHSRKAKGGGYDTDGLKAKWKEHYDNPLKYSRDNTGVENGTSGALRLAMPVYTDIHKQVTRETSAKMISSTKPLKVKNAEEANSMATGLASLVAGFGSEVLTAGMGGIGNTTSEAGGAGLFKRPDVLNEPDAFEMSAALGLNSNSGERKGKGKKRHVAEVQAQDGAAAADVAQGGEKKIKLSKAAVLSQVQKFERAHEAVKRELSSVATQSEKMRGEIVKTYTDLMKLSTGQRGWDLLKERVEALHDDVLMRERAITIIIAERFTSDDLKTIFGDNYDEIIVKHKLEDLVADKVEATDLRWKIFAETFSTTIPIDDFPSLMPLPKFNKEFDDRLRNADSDWAILQAQSEYKEVIDGYKVLVKQLRKALGVWKSAATALINADESSLENQIKSLSAAGKPSKKAAVAKPEEDKDNMKACDVITSVAIPAEVDGVTVESPVFTKAQWDEDPEVNYTKPFLLRGNALVLEIYKTGAVKKELDNFKTAFKQSDQYARGGRAKRAIESTGAGAGIAEFEKKLFELMMKDKVDNVVDFSSTVQFKPHIGMQVFGFTNKMKYVGADPFDLGSIKLQSAGKRIVVAGPLREITNYVKEESGKESLNRDDIREYFENIQWKELKTFVKNTGGLFTINSVRMGDAMYMPAGFYGFEVSGSEGYGIKIPLLSKSAETKADLEVAVAFAKTAKKPTEALELLISLQ